MRVLALDIGEVRIGVAVSDPDGAIASPVCVLPAQEVLSHARTFKAVLEDWEPELLLCGRPKTLAGEDGPQAQKITAQAEQIAKNCQLPLEFTDERLSSAEAKKILRAQGLSEKAMRGKVDMVAASLFLQSWLDAQMNKGDYMPTLSNGSSPRRQGAHFSSPVPEGQVQEEQTQQEQIKQPSVEATGSLPALTGGKLSSRSAQVTHMAKNKQVKHRDKKASKRSRIFAALIAFIMVAALGIFVWKVALPELSRANSDTQEITAGQQVTVTIPDGAGAQEVAKILFENKIIATKSEFLNQVKRQDAEQKIKSGIYVITTGAKPSDIVNLLISGPNAPGSGFVVPEGYTVSQVADLVQDYFGISRDDFLNQAKASNYVADYPFLAGAVDANDSLEGYLFPKTYTFTESNVTADTVIRAMLDQFETETADLNLDAARITLNKRYNLNLTNEQIIIMASIIEREALTDDDRPKVASVFYNRLYDDMYLQSDATLAYSLGREATAEELSSMTSDPYNTYAFKGLTPTPICSPGYASIKAAMDPAATNYYYFWITSDEHVFSETYDEHQQAIENAREREAASKQ